MEKILNDITSPTSPSNRWTTTRLGPGGEDRLIDHWQIVPIYCFGKWLIGSRLADTFRQGLQNHDVQLQQVISILQFIVPPQTQIQPYQHLRGHRFLRLIGGNHRLIVQSQSQKMPQSVSNRKWTQIIRPIESNEAPIWINRYNHPISGFLIDFENSQSTAPSLSTISSFMDPGLHKRFCRYQVGQEGTDATGRWFVAFKERKLSNTTQGDNYQIIRAPSDRFYADPFIWKHKDNDDNGNYNGKNWLFFEDADLQSGHGRIACLPLPLESTESAESSTCPKIITVLERRYHLSFPFIFKDESSPDRTQLYMIPESHQNRTIELYRCDKFPDQWSLDTVLIDDINAADTVHLYWQGRHWLFTGLEHTVVTGPQHQILAIFYADQLRGPWHRHPYRQQDPEHQMFRSAGRIFPDLLADPTGQILIRPTQDNRNGVYGYQTLFYQITRLTTEDFEQRLLTYLPPTWTTPTQCRQLYRTHTFNWNQDYWVLDGYTDR